MMSIIQQTPVGAAAALCFACLFFAPTGLAADSGAPIVLRAARLLDVSTGEMHQPGVLVVDGGKIVSVNAASSPPGAQELDLGDVTLLPGFIDAHTHLTHMFGARTFIEPVTTTVSYRAFQAAKHGRITVLAGFTTVRDFGGDVTVELGKAVDRGDLVAPRIVPSRWPLGIKGGHCDITGFAPGILERGPEDGIVSGPWEVVKAVRYQIKHGAKVIKTCATAGVLSLEGPSGAQQLTSEELTAMVEEAGRHGVKVAAHAHSAEGIHAAVSAGVASIEHGSFLTDETVRLMKKQGTYLVPTTYLVDRMDLDSFPAPIRRKAEQVLPQMRRSLKRAIDADVKIAFGTDAAVFPHGENAREFAVYVNLGMSELEALQTATIAAADLLGTEDRGRLSEGLLADIIAVPGNPLDEITVTEDVRFVMLGGRVLKHVGSPP